MPNLINTQSILEESWQYCQELEKIACDGDIIVAIDQVEYLDFEGHNGRVAVTVPNDEDIVELYPSINKADVIRLQFPAFADGRAYSQARLLRDRLGFEGDIRATGDVLRDQLFQMHRCGFSSFELREDQNAELALTDFSRFDVLYQPAADESLPLFKRR
jgi:uncharacterized protein (DUF934 family)